jgi:hypothetical protein
VTPEGGYNKKPGEASLNFMLSPEGKFSRGIDKAFTLRLLDFGRTGPQHILERPK